MKVTANHIDPGSTVPCIAVCFIKGHDVCKIWELGILLLQTNLIKYKGRDMSRTRQLHLQGLRMYKTANEFDTWAILSAISLQNWFGLSKCWIKWGRRHKTFSGNPRTRKYRTKLIFWTARATVIFKLVFHGRSWFQYYISHKLTQILSSWSHHWPYHLCLKGALIWKSSMSFRQQYSCRAWAYFCKYYCTFLLEIIFISST